MREALASRPPLASTLREIDNASSLAHPRLFTYYYVKLPVLSEYIFYSSSSSSSPSFPLPFHRFVRACLCLYLCFVCSGLPPARCVMIPSFAAFTLKTENKEEQAKQLPDLLSVPLYVRTYVRVCVLCILPSPLPTAFNRTNTARLL